MELDCLSRQINELLIDWQMKRQTIFFIFFSKYWVHNKNKNIVSHIILKSEDAHHQCRRSAFFSLFFPYYFVLNCLQSDVGRFNSYQIKQMTQQRNFRIVCNLVLLLVFLYFICAFFLFFNFHVCRTTANDHHFLVYLFFFLFNKIMVFHPYSCNHLWFCIYR